MTKGLLITSAFCMASATPLMAYPAIELQPDTVLLSAAQRAEEVQKAEEDASDFTFTESQLDEDMDAAQTVSSVNASAADPYLSQVGYTWSAMRFRVRGLDNMYSSTFLNGLEFNDLELGRYNYSLLGGLNDATRNKDGVTGFDNNAFGITGIGGGDNINLRASQIAAGQKITLTACNRNYRYRAMYTVGTGILNNGWAFAASVGYRGATEGVIEGTYYNSLSYLLAAQKLIDDRHSLSFVTFGSPTERAQQSASTEEAYWLANSHYYNPNWGYQNGEKRNARVVNDFSPTAILTWDFKQSQTKRLTVNTAFRYSRYSTTALGWTGDAYDPRPDYYKKLPSSIFNVYGSNNSTSWLDENPQAMQQWNELYSHWTESKANRQIDWDRMYYVNRQNGGASLYYQERRHNDQIVWNSDAIYNIELADNQKLQLGAMYNLTIGKHYKTMADLLGGDYFVDVDKFAINQYGSSSIQAQSDLRNPNRHITKDDKFGYDYDTYVHLAKAWAQYQYTMGAMQVSAAGHLDYTAYQRDGKMQNGQAQIALKDGSYYDNSYGKSGWAKFLGGGVKAQMGWKPAANHRVSVGASWEKKAPLVRNAFVAPRVQNNFVDNLKLEDVMGAEASWNGRFGPVSGKVAGYYLFFDNGVEQTAFYNDANSAFTYLTMSNVRKQHYGLEAALEYDILSNLSIHVRGTISEAEYINNPYAQLNTEGMNASDNAKVNKWINPVTNQNQQLLVLAERLHVGSTPLTALNLGVKYSRNYWFFEVNANYYDRVYINFAPYRRLSNIVENYVFDGASRYVTTKAYATGVYPVRTEVGQEALKQLLHTEGGVAYDQYGNIKAAYGAEQEQAKGGWMFDASVGHSIRMRHSRFMSINLQVQNIGNNTDMKTGGYEQNRDDNYYTLSDDPKIGKMKTYMFSKNAKYYYANAFNFYLNVNYRF